MISFAQEYMITYVEGGVYKKNNSISGYTYKIIEIIYGPNSGLDNFISGPNSGLKFSTAARLGRNSDVFLAGFWAGIQIKKIHLAELEFSHKYK